MPQPSLKPSFYLEEELERHATTIPETLQRHATTIPETTLEKIPRKVFCFARFQLNEV